MTVTYINATHEKLQELCETVVRHVTTKVIQRARDAGLMWVYHGDKQIAVTSDQSLVNKLLDHVNVTVFCAGAE